MFEDQGESTPTWVVGCQALDEAGEKCAREEEGAQRAGDVGGCDNKPTENWERY